MSLKQFLVLASASILESFNFSLFGILLPCIMTDFCEKDSTKFEAIAAGYFIFFISFLARLVGGIFFGYIGDIYGRKITVFISVTLMSISTFCIGIMPGYSSLGYNAYIGLFFFRILQSFCYGSSMIGGVIIATDSHESSKCFVTASIISAGVVGTILASLLCVPFSSHTEFNGVWRIPFIIGSLIGFIFVLSNIKKTFSNLHGNIEKSLIKKLIQSFSKEYRLILPIIGIGGFIGVTFYGLYVFPIGFAYAKYNIDTSLIITISSFSLFLYMILLPLMGIIADRIGHLRQMLWFSVIFIILSSFIFTLLTSDKLLDIILSEVLASIMLAGFVAPSSFILPKVFSKNIKYVGVSLGYNLGVCFFGGAAPRVFFISTTSLEYSTIPYLYFTCAGIMALSSTIFLQSYLKEHKTK